MAHDLEVSYHNWMRIFHVFWYTFNNVMPWSNVRCCIYIYFEKKSRKLSQAIKQILIALTKQFFPDVYTGECLAGFSRDVILSAHATKTLHAVLFLCTAFSFYCTCLRHAKSSWNIDGFNNTGFFQLDNSQVCLVLNYDPAVEIPTSLDTQNYKP